VPKDLRSPQDLIQAWYSSLRTFGGVPAKGSLAGALVTLERLKTNFDLTLDAHTTSGKSQIAGVGPAALRSILTRFNEKRPLLVEAGRTNRGLRGDIDSLLQVLKGSGLEKLTSQEREKAIEEMQLFLVKRIQDVFARARIKAVYDPSLTTHQYIHRVLAAAKEAGKHGPVAEYLVGAKLQIRFPQLIVENKISSSADQQRGKSGDFRIGDTVFHVTAAPGTSLYEKCKRNIDDGLKVYLIVPKEAVYGCEQNVDQMFAGKISVVSIETFISQNLDELGGFSKDLQSREVAELISIYNKRVDEVEADKSLLIEVPALLLEFEMLENDGDI